MVNQWLLHPRHCTTYCWLLMSFSLVRDVLLEYPNPYNLTSALPECVKILRKHVVSDIHHCGEASVSVFDLCHVVLLGGCSFSR
jgi:hypothetical protein